MAVALALACGGDDSPAPPGDAPAPTTLPTTAAEMLPDLASLGYTLAQKGKEPSLGPGDNAQAIYQKSGGQVLVRVYLLPDDAKAITQWTSFAEAFRNPPPQVLGAASKNVDAASPAVGQQQKSYVTEKPDGNGNLVWTDIYRTGRVVLLTQVLGRDDAGMVTVRKTIAETVLGPGR